MAGLVTGTKKVVSIVDGKRVKGKTHGLTKVGLSLDEAAVLFNELRHDPEYAKLSVGGCCTKLNKKGIFKTRAQRLLKRPLIIEGCDIRRSHEYLFAERYSTKNTKAS
jgi:hypothetical protein